MFDILRNPRFALGVPALLGAAFILLIPVLVLAVVHQVTGRPAPAAAS